MSTRDDHAKPYDAFVEEAGSLEDLELLATSLPARAPSTGLRERLLASATSSGRLAHFRAQVARLLDLPESAAQALLDAVDDEASWSEGFSPAMQLFHVRGGARVQGAITGFVRLAASETFPEHEHLGEERVLIMQGSCLDSSDGRIARAGDELTMAAGSRHAFTVRPGPDLLYLAVVFGGIKVGETVLTPDDPRA